MTFEELRAANVSRCKRWHPGFPHDDQWTGADWSNAMCGEAGETANVVKKIRRDDGSFAQGIPNLPRAELLAALADEIADVITYADLLAAYYGIDLAAAVASKFNRVSARQGFPEQLPEPTQPDDDRRSGLNFATGEVVCPICGERVTIRIPIAANLDVGYSVVGSDYQGAAAVLSVAAPQWGHEHVALWDADAAATV